MDNRNEYYGNQQNRRSNQEQRLRNGAGANGGNEVRRTSANGVQRSSYAQQSSRSARSAQQRRPDSGINAQRSARPSSGSAAQYGRGSNRYGTNQRVDSRANSRTGGRNSGYGASMSRGGYSEQTAADYSRSRGYNAKDARKSNAKFNKHGKRKKSLGFKIGMGVLGTVLLAAIGIGAYLFIIQSNLNKGVDQDLRDALVQTDYSKQAFYVLLMGVDTSAQRGDEAYSVEDARSDSMMLVRIDCPNKKVTMLSLHRDVLVDINGSQQKLNAAHEIGGPALAVKTVSKLCDVDISHYAELNFDAFIEIVDAVGGVEVEVPMEIDDELAGGHLDAGWQTLNGEQALILCRARHAYDDYGDGDVYRAANQRMVLGALAKKILSSDIATIAKTITAATQYVTTDMNLTDIIGIAQAMQGLDPSTDIYSSMMPTEGVYYEGDGWYEEIQEEEWQQMLTRMKQGLPPDTEDYVSDQTGTVLSSTGSGNLEQLGGSSGS